MGYLDLAARRVRIRATEQRAERWVEVGPETCQLLSNYRKVYRIVDRVFTGRGGKPYSTRSVQSVLAKAVRLSGIDPKTTLYSLRNSFGVHLLQQGVEPARVRELMGLSSENMVRKYRRVAAQKEQRRVA